MYNPRWFKEEKVEVLQNEVNRVSFGTIITVGKTGIMASHVPMLIDRSRGKMGILFGHVARGNMQWRDTPPGSPGLAVFLGPDAYISANWYETDKETGKTVPTWDYVAIHLRGPVTFTEDTEDLRRMVTRLTEHHESEAKIPWKITDAPIGYIDKELKQIVGFEMSIEKIEGKWKMSQNRSERDRQNVITKLLERNRPRDREVSGEIKRRG